MQALRRRVQEASEVRLVAGGGRQVVILRGPRSGRAEGDLRHRRQVGGEQRPVAAAVAPAPQRAGGRADRKSVVSGTRVAVRVAHGGRRFIKKTKNTKATTATI